MERLARKTKHHGVDGSFDAVVTKGPLLNQYVQNWLAETSGKMGNGSRSNQEELVKPNDVKPRLKPHSSSHLNANLPSKHRSWEETILTRSPAKNRKHRHSLSSDSSLLGYAFPPETYLAQPIVPLQSPHLAALHPEDSSSVLLVDKADMKVPSKPHLFEKRKRHKTREDLYEPNKNPKKRNTHDRNQSRKDQKVKKPARSKHGNNFGGDIAHRYALLGLLVYFEMAVRPHQRSAVDVGQYYREMDTNTDLLHIAVPDLAFSEIHFLQHENHNSSNANCEKHDVRERTRDLRRTACAQAEISSFFASKAEEDEDQWNKYDRSPDYLDLYNGDYGGPRPNSGNKIAATSRLAIKRNPSFTAHQGKDEDSRHYSESTMERTSETEYGLQTTETGSDKVTTICSWSDSLEAQSQISCDKSIINQNAVERQRASPMPSHLQRQTTSSENGIDSKRKHDHTHESEDQTETNAIVDNTEESHLPETTPRIQIQHKIIGSRVESRSDAVRYRKSARQTSAKKLYISMPPSTRQSTDHVQKPGQEVVNFENLQSGTPTPNRKETGTQTSPGCFEEAISEADSSQKVQIRESEILTCNSGEERKKTNFYDTVGQSTIVLESQSMRDGSQELIQVQAGARASVSHNTPFPGPAAAFQENVREPCWLHVSGRQGAESSITTSQMPYPSLYTRQLQETDAFERIEMNKSGQNFDQTIPVTEIQYPNIPEPDIDEGDGYLHSQNDSIRVSAEKILNQEPDMFDMEYYQEAGTDHTSYQETELVSWDERPSSALSQHDMQPCSDLEEYVNSQNNQLQLVKSFSGGNGYGLGSFTVAQFEGDDIFLRGFWRPHRQY